MHNNLSFKYLDKIWSNADINDAFPIAAFLYIIIILDIFRYFLS